MDLKCRKCRHILVTCDVQNLTNAHGNPRNTRQNNLEGETCETILENTEIYLPDDSVPDWIGQEIEKSQWTKGKLKCISCDSRVGFFDFVSGNRCKCSQFVLPSVHLVKSKVDQPIDLNKM